MSDSRYTYVECKTCGSAAVLNEDDTSFGPVASVAKMVADRHAQRQGCDGEVTITSGLTKSEADARWTA